MNDTKNEEIEPREIKESESKTGKRSLFVRVCDRINKEWLVWTMAIAAVLVIVCPMPRDVHVAFSVIFAAGILYASYFFVSGWLFSENTDNHILSGIRTELRKIPQDVLFKFSCPVWIFFTAECIVGDYASIDILHRIMNVALLILLYKVIAIIMRNIPLYILVASLGVMIFYISSYFITIYRSRPITPWDFFGIGTVLDVTPHYSFSLNIGMIAGLVLCVVMYLIMKMLPKRKHRISKYYIVYPLPILMIMVNPKIIKKSGEYAAEEGCLSLAGTKQAKRWQEITVSYRNESFRSLINTFRGFTAQIIQHECDHCEGILV